MLQEVSMEHKSSSFLGERTNIISKDKVEMKHALNLYSMVNAQVAVDIYSAVLQRHARNGVPSSKDEIQTIGHYLDTRATELMEAGLHGADFVSEVIPEGCEGAKENRKALELGVGRTDLRVLEGTYGLGHLVPFIDRNSLRGEKSKVKLTIDPVEGTTKASLNQDGSVAIIAGTLSGEIAAIPTEKSSAKYADRIVASSRLKGKVRLTNTTDENIMATMEEFGVLDPNEVEVVVMERDRNKRLIEDLQRIGVNLRLINSGDLMPAIEALTKNKPILSIGSGGKQEAIIAACAARALGGVFELRYVTKEGNPTDEYPGVLKLDDIVSGDASDCFVNFASITGVENLEMLPPQEFGNNHLVSVATITGRISGMAVNKIII